jgi:HrpA-like RNA helicase
LQGLSHIVIDEVHERHLETDLLMAYLREALQADVQRGLAGQQRRLGHLKVVLMSATMQEQRLRQYWAFTGVGVTSLDTQHQHQHQHQR